VIAGFVNLGAPSEILFPGMDGHIAALYILQAFQRQGLGRRLLGAAAGEWLSRGGISMALGVLAENHQARKFYESLGAKLVHTGTYEWEGHPLDDAIYVFENLAELAAIP
jgi:ribosomal protein S18 acetylase RimI-like enzyme